MLEGAASSIVKARVLSHARVLPHVVRTADYRALLRPSTSIEQELDRIASQYRPRFGALQDAELGAARSVVGEALDGLRPLVVVNRDWNLGTRFILEQDDNLRTLFIAPE